MTSLETHLPLLAGQREIWIADRAGAVPGGFVNAQATTLDIRVDPVLFARAATQVVAETECLRLRIRDTPEGPVQAVQPAPSRIDVPLVDLAREADPEAAAAAWMRAAAVRPIDPAVGPPFAWTLLRLGPERSVWCQVYNHVAIDSAGRDRVVARLAVVYDAMAAGRDLPPADPAPTLADLVAREADRLASPRGADDLAWCREQLAEAPAAPGPSRRPPAAAAVASRATRGLDPGRAAALRSAARGLDVTLPQVMCAAWIGFLARVSYAEDVLIGLQVAGRSGDAWRTPATLTNLLPLRLAVRADAPFADLAASTARAMRQALRRQTHPHQRTRAALGLRPGEPDPLAVGFNFAPPADPVLVLGLPTTTRNLAHGPVAALCLGVEPQPDGGLLLDLDTNPSLYRPDEAAGLVDRLVLLLADLGRTGGAGRLADLAIMEPAERHRVVHAFAGTAPAPPAQTLDALWPREAGETPALVAGDVRLSYAGLDAAANRLARHLAARGIGPGAVVGLGLPRSADLIVALLAVLRTGAAFSPLDPAHPPARLAQMLATSRARLLLTAEGGIADPPPGIPILRLDDPANREAVAHAEPGPLDHGPTGPAAPAYIVFTSGSTGTPKGVAVSHGAASRFAGAMAGAVRLRPGDALLGVTTLAFDVGIGDVLLALTQGATLVLAGEAELRDPDAVLGLLRRHAVRALVATPSYWRTLPIEALPGGLAAYIGGEAFPVDLLARFPPAMPVANVYGPTEATIWATIHPVRPGDAADGIVPVGRPLPGYRAWILDRGGAPVPPGIPGELHLGGDALADGYVGEPALTAARFVACPFDASPLDAGRMYRTGDLARWRVDGLIEVLGRDDAQVKIAGHRVEPGEVEHAIRRLPGVADAAVIAHGDAGRRALAAYVVPRAGAAPPDRTTLAAALADRLPPYMIPADCVVLDALPRTVSEKLDRRALPPIVRGAARPSRPPASPDEALLCQLFARIAKVSAAGVDDDFFALGAGSLAAMLLVSEARRHGRTLPLALLFERRTPAAIAAAWAAAAPVPEATPDALFLIPGMGGDAPGMAKLRAAAAGALPMVLLDYPDWPTLARPGYGMADLAHDFAARIAAAAPASPLRLAGYSFGGFVAWEAAAILAARGRQIGFVGLLDCRADRLRPPSTAEGAARRAYWDAAALLDAARRGGIAERVGLVASERLAVRSRHRRRLRALARLRAAPLPSHLRYWLHRYVTEALQAGLVRAWHPAWSAAPVARDLPAVLFRADWSGPGHADDLGWSRHCTTLRIVRVAGEHRSMLADHRLAALRDRIVEAVG